MSEFLIAMLFILTIFLYPFIFSFVFVLVSDIQMPCKPKRPETIRDVLTIIFYNAYTDNSNYNKYINILWSVNIPLLGFLIALFFTFAFLIEFIFRNIICSNLRIKSFF